MIYILLSAVIIVADQLFKAWVVAHVPVGADIQLIPGILTMTHVKNTGAAFSLFQGMQPIILAITGLFCILAVLALISKAVKGGFGNLSLAMILGGALGNFIDRIETGKVVDMFDFAFMKFAVFNIADIFITFGAAFFCLFVLLYDKRKTKPGELKEKGNEASVNIEKAD